MEGPPLTQVLGSSPDSHHVVCTHARRHAHRHAHRCTDLTYCREGYKSLHEKASGWSELVCFLNQHIKAHLRKERKQKMHDAARAHDAHGREE